MPILLLFLLAWIALSSCDGVEKLACMDAERQHRSDMSAAFCISFVGDEPQDVGQSLGYGFAATSATYVGTGDAPQRSCEGQLYDFAITDNTLLRVTLRVVDHEKSVLPDLDLERGALVKIRAEKPFWSPDTLVLEDKTGPVFYLASHLLMSGWTDGWLQVSLGEKIDEYCTGCGTYGVHKLRFKTADDGSVVSLKPGQRGTVWYRSREYVIANLESTDDIDVKCSDADGTTHYVAWRLKK